MYLVPAWTFTDFHLGAGGRHQLRDANGADVAFRILVELRLLITLGRKHQRVEIVFRAIGLKEFQGLTKALLLRRAGGVGDLLDLLEVLLFPPVEGTMLFHEVDVEIIELGIKLGAVLADSPAD